MPTVSPAKLFLGYSTNGIQHTASVNLQSGVDIQNVANLRVIAIDMATLIANATTPSVEVDRWGLRSFGGVELYSEGFVSAFLGNKTPPINAVEWNSYTIKFEGKASGTGVGAPRGRTHFLLYTSDSLVMLPGEKYQDVTAVASLNAIRDYLTTSLEVFCDIFGQKADCSVLAPVQFNAHTQKEHGA